MRWHLTTESEPKSGQLSQSFDEAHIGGAAKACAAGAGVIGSVCCGAGPTAVIASALGAGGAVSFMLSWGNMQGVTLISTGIALLVVLSLSWLVTRGVRRVGA